MEMGSFMIMAVMPAQVFSQPAKSMPTDLRPFHSRRENAMASFLYSQPR